MILASTVYVYVYERSDKDKIGIYPHDVGAIFFRLRVDICFIDENDKIFDVKKGISGISDWI
jgi:hypothetical protein